MVLAPSRLERYRHYYLPSHIAADSPSNDEYSACGLKLEQCRMLEKQLIKWQNARAAQPPKVVMYRIAAAMSASCIFQTRIVYQQRVQQLASSLLYEPCRNDAGRMKSSNPKMQNMTRFFVVLAMLAPHLV
jgi:hypothetical protein